LNEEDTLRAVVYQEYGTPDVLHLKNIKKPIPEDDEVLIEIHAASVNAYDWHFLTADVFLIRFMGGGILKPKKNILGADISGRVIEFGKKSKKFKIGDEVFGVAKGGCGGFAEYVCAREKSLELKPSNTSFEEAAAAPMAAITALQGLRDKGQIKPGDKVLIYGASGGVGTFAVQIAASYKANVTAVCSARNVDRALSIGASKVIDYNNEDFTKNGEFYGLILVVNGNRSIFEYKRSLKSNGNCVLIGGSSNSIFQLIAGIFMQWWISKTGKKKISSFLANINQKDLEFIRNLIESEKIKPVIDRIYPLKNTAEALQYIGKGHAQGKIIITLEKYKDL
jgi:NADPH:quinone reductase-like Zn-dependent oxidoreductase